jgi:hypothetical protein
MERNDIFLPSSGVYCRSKKGLRIFSSHSYASRVNVAELSLDVTKHIVRQTAHIHPVMTSYRWYKKVRYAGLSVLRSATLHSTHCKDHCSSRISILKVGSVDILLCNFIWDSITRHNELHDRDNNINEPQKFYSLPKRYNRIRSHCIVEVVSATCWKCVTDVLILKRIVVAISNSLSLPIF